MPFVPFSIEVFGFLVFARLELLVTLVSHRHSSYPVWQLSARWHVDGLQCLQSSNKTSVVLKKLQVDNMAGVEDLFD